MNKRSAGHAPEDQTRLFVGKSRRGKAPSGTTEAKRKALVIDKLTRLGEALLIAEQSLYIDLYYCLIKKGHLIKLSTDT
jgi:hypothetical protein